MSDDENVLYQDLLEKHIERKINEALRRKFSRSQMDSDAVNLEEEPTGTCSNLAVRGDIIPAFDPDDKTLTITGWLQKIDQLGEIHNWTEYQKTTFMQQKLRGSARNWFNRLDDYRKTWVEWKTALMRAFPRCTDYATVLEELVARNKKSGETMTHYYHEKLALIQQCRLDDDAAISCLIKGLPLELQANARAFQCTTPDELYAGFIAPLENYQSPRQDYQEKTKRSKYENTSTRAVECFSCGKYGHISRDCRLKGSLRCHYCNRFGHKKEHCRFRHRSFNKPEASTVSESKSVKLINEKQVNQTYAKECFVDNERMLAYLDSGSQANIIHVSAVIKAKLQAYPSCNSLKAFGGSVVKIEESVNFSLKIDDLVIKTHAFVTAADMDNFDIIIGQPVINAEGVSLVVCLGSARLTEDNFSLLREISLESNELYLKIVVVDAGDEEEVYMEAKRFQLENNLICIPGMVFRGSRCVVPISNAGNAEVVRKEGWLIGRGRKCVNYTTMKDQRESLVKYNNNCSRNTLFFFLFRRTGDS